MTSTTTIVPFFGTRGSDPANPDERAFSQWWEHSPFTVDGIGFRTAEHAMMHGKAMTFRDHAIANQILTVRSPREAKALGRKVADFDAEVWARVSWGIVLHANIAKFTQNRDIASVLLATGDALLVEASPYDKIWGAGICATDPRIHAGPDAWPGANRLGQILMQVRQRLVQLQD